MEKNMDNNEIVSNDGFVNKKMAKALNKELKQSEKAYKKNRELPKVFAYLLMSSIVVGTGLSVTGAFFEDAGKDMVESILASNNYIASEQISKDDFMKQYDMRGYIKSQDLNNAANALVLAGTGTIVLAAAGAGVCCCFIPKDNGDNQTQMTNSVV